MMEDEEMQDNEMAHTTKKQHCQMHENNTFGGESNKSDGSVMQTDNSVLLVAITFACNALMACAKQLDIMDKRSGNYGSTLAQSAKAIKIAIEENRILATRPSTVFSQLSQIIERETGGLRKGKIYSLLFNSVALSFMEVDSEEELTAQMWLNALTAVKLSDHDISLIDMHDILIVDTLSSVKCILRFALHPHLNPIDAFREAVEAAECYDMQTEHTKSLKHAIPEIHAVSVWMRAAYEGVKLKLGYRYNV